MRRVEINGEIKTNCNFVKDFFLFLLSSTPVFMSTSDSQRSIFIRLESRPGKLWSSCNHGLGDWILSSSNLEKYHKGIRLYSIMDCISIYVEESGVLWLAASINITYIKGRGKFFKRRMNSTDMFIMGIVYWGTTSSFLSQCLSWILFLLRWNRNIWSYKAWKSIKEFMSGRNKHCIH